MATKSLKFFVWSVIMGVIVNGQFRPRIGGNPYIERQLLCALDRVPCDNVGQQIKDALPEIIGNGCGRCDLQQSANARRIAQFVQANYPLVWRDLVVKYS